MIYVLTYPDFAPEIAAKIDRFRREHEPHRATLVQPHVTLVFALKTVSALDVIAFCERVAKTSTEIDILLATSECAYDPFEKTNKLLLVVSTGSAELQHLHEQLYDGPHRAELHPGFPYRAHVTVAANDSRDVIEGLDAGAMGSFPIAGKIKAVEVVALAEGRLNSLATFPLAKPAMRSGPNIPAG